MSAAMACLLGAVLHTNAQPTSKKINSILQLLYPDAAAVLCEPNGRWQMISDDSLQGTFANGQTALNAGIKSGKFHGHFYTYHANGQLHIQGKMHQNFPDGHWQFFNSSGHLVAEKNYSASKAKAYTIWARQPNAKLRHGQLQLEPFSTANGMATRPPFSKAVLHGDFIYYGARQKPLQTGEYIGGIKTGRWVRFNQNGEPQHTSYFIAGKLHGPSAWYQEAGVIKTLLQYRQGQLQYQRQYPSGH